MDRLTELKLAYAKHCDKTNPVAKDYISALESALEAERFEALECAASCEHFEADLKQLESTLEAAEGKRIRELESALRSARIHENDLEAEVKRLEEERDAAVRAIRAMCKRHCNIKPDELCAVPECPAEPYRPTTDNNNNE
jgi:hypothetical protein